MKPCVVKPVSGLKGRVLLLGDKSIAHRAIIISAISRGKTKIENFPRNIDCLATLKTLQKLGVKIKKLTSGDFADTLIIFGRGLRGLKQPDGPLEVADSGTTFRLMLGLLSGQNLTARLLAGKSLSKRPMLRVTQPLRRMGAVISAKRKAQGAKLEEYPPVTIKGGKLRGITYRMPVASAQVKSAILLAGLNAKGITSVIEPVPTRDHTERMLKLFKADIKDKQNQIVIRGGRDLTSPASIYVPGDISSAAFFLVMAAITPDSTLLIKNVGLNPSRSGIIRVLRRMGLNLRIIKQMDSTGETIGDLLVKSSGLKAVTVEKEEVPLLIDELPILMIAACKAKGRTILKGVNELRVKETDRIRSMKENLKRMGARVKVRSQGGRQDIIIDGVGSLKGARVRSFGDHRTAMSMVAAGLIASGRTCIDDISCINKSFPNFSRVLAALT